MPTLIPTHKHFFWNIGSLLAELAHTLFRLLPTTAFLLMSMFPSKALAYSLYVDPSGSLLFETKHLVFDEPLPPASYPFKAGSVLGVTTSAYSSTVEQTDGDPFTTASGSRVREGVIATNFLPLGTVVAIGNKTFVVEDRMNSRYNNSFRLDIWMASTEDARRHGVRPAVIEIVSLPQ